MINKTTSWKNIKSSLIYSILLLLSLITNAETNQDIKLTLSIQDSVLKQHLQALSLDLGISPTTDSTTKADFYLAVSTPERQLFFIHAEKMYGSSFSYSLTPIPYAKDISISEQTGKIFSLDSLASSFSYGYYTFYTLIVKSDQNVFNQESWLSLLTKTSFSITDSNSSLPIPSLLEGDLNDQAELVFNLKVQQGEHSFLAGTTTSTYGYNGSYLGPTIRVNNNDKVLFNIQNTLNEETTVHWHGVHVPAKMDGGPHQTIAAGETWQPYFTIKQGAATLWYHPHQLGKTAEHVVKGLAGFFIVEDTLSKSLAIPQNYGVDDIPVVVQDRIIYSDGSMPYNLNMMDIMQGYLGDKIVVNGAINPKLNVAAEVVRLRLLNGSNARVYNFGFSDQRNFYQIASDGGLLEKPIALTRVRLSPGERAEILVDLRDELNSSIKLVSYSSEINSTLNFSSGMMNFLSQSNFEIMQIDVVRANQNQLTIPADLVAVEKLQTSLVSKTREFILRAQMNMGFGMGMNNNSSSNSNDFFTINNSSMDMNVINETVKLGDTEIWEVWNDSMMAHPFHVHDVQFQVLSRNNQPSDENENGWKDTVLVLPNERVKFIIRFDDFADSESPYMYHCHILEHEDAGMMGQFLVIP